MEGGGGLTGKGDQPQQHRGSEKIEMVKCMTFRAPIEHFDVFVTSLSELAFPARFENFDVFVDSLLDNN